MGDGGAVGAEGSGGGTPVFGFAGVSSFVSVPGKGSRVTGSSTTGGSGAAPAGSKVAGGATSLTGSRAIGSRAMGSSAGGAGCSFMGVAFGVGAGISRSALHFSQNSTPSSLTAPPTGQVIGQPRAAEIA